MGNSEVVLSFGGKYGIVKLTGFITNKSVREHPGALRYFSEETAVKRFLIDAREAQYIGSDVSKNEFESEVLPELNFSKKWRIAILASENDSSLDFMTAAFQNAGFKAGVFKKYENARDWLEGRSANINEI